MAGKLVFWVEGPTDACKDSDGVIGGGIPPLVLRSLETLLAKRGQHLARLCPSLDDVEVETLSEVRRSVKGFSLGEGGPFKGRKQLLLASLKRRRYENSEDVFIAVWDHDGNDVTIAQRNEIHDICRRNGESGLACGVCVRTLEAWMIADAGAFKELAGQGPGEPPAAPEDDPDPKGTYRRIAQDLGLTGKFDSTSRAFFALAEQADLETLRARCPQGFADFYDALGEFIVGYIAP